MKKLRTRQHIIEDLGFNHVEKQTLLVGFVMNRIRQNDYGYDGTINTFNERGEVENLYIFFQLKSTDNMNYSVKRNAFVFDLSKRDLELWLYNPNPVLILLYDAKNDKTYFADLQAYFKKNKAILKEVRKFVRIYVPSESIFNTTSVQELRKFLK
jgi:Domain of unknown function (DUF4365)